MDALIDDLPYAVDNVVVSLAITPGVGLLVSFWCNARGKNRARRQPPASPAAQPPANSA
jgi:hypothetical protein